MAILTHPLEEKFEDALYRIPRPGGNGCHQALLGAANYGAMAGYDEDAIVERLAAHVPPGDRDVPERELRDAARKALRDHALRQTGGRRTKMPHGEAKSPPFAVRQFMLDHLKSGSGTTAQNIMGVSPVPIPENPADHSCLLIETLYGDRLNESLFIGDTTDTFVRSASEWLDAFRRGQAIKPHIIPNTFTGAPGLKKDGAGHSYRADSSVKSFMFSVAEFDKLPAYLLHEDFADLLAKDRDIEDGPFPQSWQLAFWTTVQLPIVALIDSGGKSIHAWLKIEDCTDNACWEQTVENRLYRDFLVPLGVDSACRNESRLSRLPGFFRPEKGRHQRMLYLNPEGRPVCEFST